jgi:hypothetical protein
MDGPLRLNAYLTDPWLGEHTGQPHVGRDRKAEREAVRDYLGAQTGEWRELVAEHEARLPPLAAASRVVVFLLADNEEEGIDRCLIAIVEDLVASNLRYRSEIVVVRQSRHGMVLDDTAERVRRFAAAHRDGIAVHLIEVEWPADCMTFLPLSRKLAVDVVATRALAAALPASLYLITEDADIEWIERGRAGYVVRTFDANPHLDALRGWHMRSLDLLEYLPLFVERLTWRACEHALSHSQLQPRYNQAYDFAWNRVVTAGWNVAFTLEAYVQAGGYTPTVELFEDMDLGQRISVMRGQWENDIFVPGTETVDWMPYEAASDGRRALAALVGGTDIYGGAPSLAGFVDATQQARGWSMADAMETARSAAHAEMIDHVLARRRDEVARIVGEGEVLDAVMAAARRELGAPATDMDGLVARQRSFLTAARAVAAGDPSADHASVLRPAPVKVSQRPGHVGGRAVGTSTARSSRSRTRAASSMP